MECSWSEEASILEDDLALSDSDDSTVLNHWPNLPTRVTTNPLLVPQHVKRQAASSFPATRPAEDAPASTTKECLPPASKTVKGSADERGESTRSSLPCRGSPLSASPPPMALAYPSSVW